MMPRGHSQAVMTSPIIRLMVCSTGIGFTAPSRFLVRKSQKILGQKKPWSAAAIWSGSEMLVKFVERSWFVGKRTYSGREDDEARPVVLDEFAHCVLNVYSSHCSPEPATPESARRVQPAN